MQSIDSILQQIQDQRSKEQQKEEQKAIQQLVDLNLKRFYPQPNEIKIKYIIKKAIFDEDLYCYYSDNQKLFSDFRFSNITILTIPGMSGHMKEWRHIHQKLGANICRWVNFVPPGVDTEDERRGKNYQGYLKDVVELMASLLNKLQIQKVILVFHSFGTFPCVKFAEKYPERVQGMMYLGAAGFQSFPFLEYFYKYELDEFIKLGFSYEQKEDFLNNNQIRQHLYNSFLNNFAHPLQRRLKYTYSINELMYYYKIILSYDNFTDICNCSKQLSTPILKFFAAGKQDNIFSQTMFEEMFYYYTLGQKAWIHENRQKININAVKDFCQSLGIDINYEDLQQNFVFIIKGQDHYIHVHGSRALAKPIFVYLKIIDIISENELKVEQTPKL